LGLRIVTGRSQEMYAWVRYAPGARAGDKVTKLDIDLCDEQGNICVQMRGVSWRPTLLEIFDGVLDQEASSIRVADPETTLAPSVRKEIRLLSHKPASPVPETRKKPMGLTLTPPSTLVVGAVSSENPAPITLSMPTLSVPLEERTSAAVSSVKLYDEGQGIFSIHIAASVNQRQLAKDVIGEVVEALK